MNEEFVRIKIGDMYVKDFKINTFKDVGNNWRVRREITLINNVNEGIPIIKEEAQGIMKLLDKSVILEPLTKED